MKKLIAFVSTMMIALLAAGASFLYSTIPQEERGALNTVVSEYSKVVYATIILVE